LLLDLLSILNEFISLSNAERAAVD